MATSIVVYGQQLLEDTNISSGFPNSTNKNWVIADGYRLTTSRDMYPVYPKQTVASSMAAFKWADTSTIYKIRPTWRGGHPPYRVTVFKAPTGAQLNGVSFSGSEIVQEYTRTLDATTTRYIHDLPNNFCELTHQFQIGDVGQTFEWGIVVHDQNNRTISIQWTTQVSNTNVKYFDSVAGNDANDGSFATPYQTAAFGYALANAQNYIFKFKDGSYAINSDFAITSTKCKSWIGVGDAVSFDMTAGLFSSGVDDQLFMGINFTGAKLDAPDTFNHKYNLVSRCTFHDCTFNNNFVGTVNTDNSAAIAFWGNTTLEHQDISITNCNQLSTVKSQMLTMFDVNGVIVENCHVSNAAYDPGSGGGSKFLHVKDETKNITIRHCTASGTSERGLISFSNQGPIQCDQQELLFCAVDNLGAPANNGPYVWNDQSVATPCKGTNQYIQRCTAIAHTQTPLWFRSLGSGGEPVNIEGILYSTTNALILEGGSNGGTYMGHPSVQVPAAKLNTNYTMTDDIKGDNLGITGHQIASPLVN